MLHQLEALIALTRTGTVSAAAVELRITQSAVSKRIASLEAQLGRDLIEPHGRGVRLTPDGADLVARSRPLVAALNEVLTQERDVRGGRLVLGVSESLLASWAPAVLATVRSRIPGLDLVLHAHRSPVAVEHVRSGAYGAALVAGDADGAPDLSSADVMSEDLVLVPSRLRPGGLPGQGVLHVLSIESGSATARSLRRQLGRLAQETGLELRVERTVESYAALVQLARAGFGHGLAPRGVARALGIAPTQLIELPGRGLQRPIRFTARPTTFQLPLVAAVRAVIESEALRLAD